MQGARSLRTAAFVALRDRIRDIPISELSSMLFCFVALAAVVRCLSDYNMNWMHPEIFLAEEKDLSGQTGMHWQDLAHFFDCQMTSDECQRTRFLSYLTSYVNPFARLWLLQFMPPHPSLSVTWILSLASLYFFYRVIFWLTRDRTAACLGVGLYALSAGFLSMMLMLFNPAKPLAGFFVNFCLYLATKIQTFKDRRACSATAILLYFSLFLAYCSDETAWILYGAIPVLFPDFLRRRSWRLALCLLLTFPLFLAFITWGAPNVIRYFWGYQNFDFWGWTFNVGRQALPDQLSFFERFRASALWIGAGNMLRSQYAWWQSGARIEALSLWGLGGAVLSAGFFGRRDQRALFVRTVIMFFLFLAFQGLIELRAANEVGFFYSDRFYYGALSSNFSLFVVAAAASCVRRVPTARCLCILAALYIGYVSFTRCLEVNRNWIVVHDGIYARTIGNRYGPLRLGAPLSEEKVAAYWRAAQAGHDTSGLWASFAPKDAWLFNEMDAWRRRQP